MLRVGVFALVTSFGCSDSDCPCPVFPHIVFPKTVVVTEGGSTTFALSLDEAPTSQLNGFLNTLDQSVAVVMPSKFEMSPTNYPALMTLYGVDDMAPNPSNRSTSFEGRFALDDAVYGGGKAQVVDNQSLNVIATNWNITLMPSSSTTFGVELTQPPAASTTITLVLGANGTNASLIAVSPGTLVFGPADYNIAQTVTVTSDMETGATQIELSPSNGVPAQEVLVTVVQ